MPNQLLSSDADSDAETLPLKLNSDYAKSYDRWREKEELQKLKDKYGNVDLTSGDDSSTDEDEVGEEITAQTEKDFLVALAALKSGDYASDGRKFFEAAGASSSKANEKATHKGKEKPMTLKDYERVVVLNREGKYEASDDEEAQPNLVYDMEQKRLKEELLRAMGNEGGGNEDDLLTKRVKTEADEEAEEAAYVEWLKGHEVQLAEDEKVKLKPLHDYWTGDNLDEDEKFLKDFFLNRRYRDKDDDEIPTYEEIVREHDEEEEELAREAKYERKYNFRFEEPDSEFLKSYPRAIPESVRAEDVRRKEKRLEYKKRKEQARRQKEEEIKQLKNLKRKELMEKVEKLKRVAGNDALSIGPEDVEGDFDPSEHDKRMEALFGNDEALPVDAEKPVFSDSDPDEDWDNFETFGDEDSDRPGPSQPYESRSQKNLTVPKSEQLKSALRQKKPAFDADSKSFEDYLAEYYALDYEDIIGGDLPVRFKYREVEPNDFGLSVDEIINADDRELNSWVSLKKVASHRTHNEEEHDRQRYLQQSADVEKKRKLLPSVYDDSASRPSVSHETPGETKKKKRRRNKKKSDLQNGTDDQSMANTSKEAQYNNDVHPHSGKNLMEIGPVKESDGSKTTHDPAGQMKKTKRRENPDSVEVDGYSRSDLKRTKLAQSPAGPSGDLPKKSRKDRKKDRAEKKKNADTVTYVGEIADERLAAYGLNPRRFRNKLKYSEKYQNL